MSRLIFVKNKTTFRWLPCTDINECDSKPCGIGWCNNYVGGYNCTCLSG